MSIAAPGRPIHPVDLHRAAKASSIFFSIMQGEIVDYIRRHELISGGERVLVAVSGGPDSIALLHLLHELGGEFRLHLELAHLQHGIRGDEAKEDARFVAALANDLNVPFHLREIDLPEMRSSRGGNVEALARRERYRFFAEVVERRRLDKVATAHTRDDQVETVLMWFLRGAGVRGLGGMAPRQELNIAGNGSTQKLIVVRPLLRTSKAEVLRFLQQQELAFRIDQTNLDRALLRNWIRLDLLPTIERRIGSGLKTRLSQQAELCRDEDDLLDDLARSRYREMVLGDGLARPALLREPPALQRRILRMWIEQAKGDLRGLDFVHIDAMLRLITDGPPQGSLSIPGGWELVREYDVLKLAKTFRGSARVCYNYPLEIGKVLVVPEARLELWSRRVSGISRLLEDDLMGAVFDAASVTEPLSVRNFRPGDRFQPLGMAGHKKVKDLFIEKRVPRSMRACWPLVTSGGEVLWIPRYGRSSVGLVSEKTTSVLHLKARSIPAWPGALKC